MRACSFLHVVLILTPATAAFAGTATITQNISVQLDSAGKLAAPSALSLLSSGLAFTDFAGSLNLQYRFRTTPAGSGAITVRAGADFSPSGGPSLSSAALRYSCSGAGLGTACSGLQTVSASAETPIVQIPGSACTGGGGSCSAADPVSIQLQFSLDNSPQYQTGSYSIPLIFTISTL